MPNSVYANLSFSLPLSLSLYIYIYIYIHILYIYDLYFNRLWVTLFINDSEIIYLHTVKRFQVFLFIVYTRKKEEKLQERKIAKKKKKEKKTKNEETKKEKRPLFQH